MICKGFVYNIITSGLAAGLVSAAFNNFTSNYFRKKSEKYLNEQKHSLELHKESIKQDISRKFHKFQSTYTAKSIIYSELYESILTSIKYFEEIYQFRISPHTREIHLIEKWSEIEIKKYLDETKIIPLGNKEEIRKLLNDEKVNSAIELIQSSVRDYSFDHAYKLNDNTDIYLSKKEIFCSEQVSEKSKIVIYEIKKTIGCIFTYFYLSKEKYGAPVSHEEIFTDIKNIKQLINDLKLQIKKEISDEFKLCQ